MPRFFLVLALLAAGCTVELPGPEASLPESRAPSRHPAEAAADSIRVASFNIQVFGVSKLDKPDVMDILAMIVRRFDVVAVQEVRSIDQTVVPQFVELINADGAQYDHVLGPRLGRTSSKEQYVFIYNTQRIELIEDSVRTVSDPDDLLHREPLVASFRVRGPPPEEAFTFTLVNIHTDPDEVPEEIDALADVFLGVQQSGSEDDVILLGDLNADPEHFDRLGEIADMAWAIAGEPTNTRRTACYDNLVFDETRTREYTGRSGVLDIMAEYGLSGEAAALEVSDHLPVWAEFSGRESDQP